MEIIVLSRQNACKYSCEQHSKPSIIISITDPNRVKNNLHCTENNRIKSVLSLKFDDIERPYRTEYDKLFDELTDEDIERQYGYKFISNNDADKIIRFVNDNINDIGRIVVHCEAGVSRSAGVAAALGAIINHDDFFIFDNPKFVPNMTCYRAVLEAYNRYLDKLPEGVDDVFSTEEIDNSVFDDKTISDKEKHNIERWKVENDLDIS